MSGKLVGEVFRCAPADLTPAEMIVLVYIAEQARDNDRTARYAEAAKVSADTHLAYGTTRNVLSGLVKRGLLTRVLDRAHHGKIQHYKLSELHEHHRLTTNRPSLESVTPG